MINGKVVFGAMCISRDPEMLKLTIPNLLKYSDKVLLLLDNESDEVRDLALDFQAKNYSKIWLRRSSIPHTLLNRRGDPVSYYKRWKSAREIVRDEVFVNLRRIQQYYKTRRKNYNDRIDILLFPDQDEMFTDYLPELIDKLWESKKHKAVALKHVHVIDNMRTIKWDHMGHHVHILKYSDDLCAIPRQFHNNFYPVKGSEIMRATYYSIHLSYYTKKQREWRYNNWKKRNLADKESALWTLDKDVEHMSSQEIKDTFERKPDGKIEA